MSRLEPRGKAERQEEVGLVDDRQRHKPGYAPPRAGSAVEIDMRGEIAVARVVSQAAPRPGAHDSDVRVPAGCAAE